MTMALGHRKKPRIWGWGHYFLLPPFGSAYELNGGVSVPINLFSQYLQLLARPQLAGLSNWRQFPTFHHFKILNKAQFY